MYKLKVESIPASDRNYFKSSVLKISPYFKVSFNGENLEVTYNESYVINEGDLINKSMAIHGLKSFLGDFRTYQFNQVN